MMFSARCLVYKHEHSFLKHKENRDKAQYSYETKLVQTQPTEKESVSAINVALFLVIVEQEVELLEARMFVSLTLISVCFVPESVAGKNPIHKVTGQV